MSYAGHIHAVKKIQMSHADTMCHIDAAMKLLKKAMLAHGV